MNDDDTPSLGPCCRCGDTELVRTIITLPYKNAIPGRGWGCFGCGLDCDGASAVLCDPCADGYRAGTAKLVEVCRGWPGEDGREPIETARARGVHHHDLAQHDEEPWR